MSTSEAQLAVRAATCRVHGEPDVVRVESFPRPCPGPDQVRVAVAAAAVNFPDVLLIAGRYQVPLEPPFVPGSEFSGRITGVGSSVESLHVGDVVHGAVMHGAFAEEIVVAADAVRILADGIDLVTAASFGVAHVTAFDTLRSVADLRAGEELVVLGAGGGVGLAAVEIGHHLGADVTAVASSAAKLEVARRHGARRTIDHSAGDLREQLRSSLPGGADVVVDPVGGVFSEPALRSLRWAGRFVTVGYATGDIPAIPLNLVLLKGISILGYQSGSFRQHRPTEVARNESELTQLLASGQLRPHIDSVFALDDVAEAVARVASGQAIGKVVIDIGL